MIVCYSTKTEFSTLRYSLIYAFMVQLTRKRQLELEVSKLFKSEKSEVKTVT